MDKDLLFPETEVKNRLTPFFLTVINKQGKTLIALLKIFLGWKTHLQNF
jgi:hypothetical protein